MQLAEPVRFTAAWERGASLRLRRGDATALDDYDQQGRIRGAPPDEQPSRHRPEPHPCAVSVDRRCAAPVMKRQQDNRTTVARPTDTASHAKHAGSSNRRL